MVAPPPHLGRKRGVVGGATPPAPIRLPPTQA